MSHESKEVAFPKLMGTTKGLVVLFSYAESGVVVRSGAEPFSIGDYNEEWDMNCFTDYDGVVILKGPV